MPNQLKVEGLPKKITLDRLKFFFKNKKNGGGCEVEEIDLCQESGSAIITIKNENDVERLLHLPTPLQLRDSPLRLQRFEEDKFSSSQDEDAYELDHTNSDQVPSSPVESEIKTRVIKVKGVPASVTKGRLKTFFENAKRYGGGPIEDINLNDEPGSAIITFETCEAVDIILKRGGTLKISNAIVSVSALLPENAGVEDPDQNSPNSEEEVDNEANEDSPTDLGPSDQSSHEAYENPPTDSCASGDDPFEGEKASNSSETETEVERDSTDIKSDDKQCRDDSESSDGESFSIIPCPNMNKQETVNESEGEDRLPFIVKVNIIDVTKSKTSKMFYKLYFNHIGFKSFDVDTLTLNGLDKCLYVAFSNKVDALAFCEYSHSDKTDSNISSAAMVSQAPLQIYSDCISIHGIDFTATGMKEKLIKFVEKQTGLCPDDILLGEEARSAIIRFPSEDLKTIFNATWKCASKLDGIFLRTAPVFKSQSVHATGDLEDLNVSMLQWYFENPDDSGGGPCSVEQDDDGLLITFDRLEDQENVLNKSKHELDEVEIELSPVYSCLSKAAYQSDEDKAGASQNTSKQKISQKGGFKPATRKATSESRKRTNVEEERDDTCLSEKTQTKKCFGDQQLYTVRVNVHDVTKPKEFYLFYFNYVGFSSPEKDSLILDALNHCFFMSFSKEEDAQARCDYKYADDGRSNISSVEMASDEDLQFYPDLISVHGGDFTAPRMREKLSNFIERETKQRPVEIVFGEEARSAIIKFPSEDLCTLSNATWACAKELDGVLLATAPVPKSKSVHVKGYQDLDMLEWYFKRPDYGGHCQVEKDDHGAIVSFKGTADQEKVLKQGNHTIGDKKLKPNLFYRSLSKTAYRSIEILGCKSGTVSKNRFPQPATSPTGQQSRKQYKGSNNQSGESSGERLAVKKKEEFSLDDRLPRTIKVHINDVGIGKDYYINHFESISFAAFDEDSLLLDGLNSCVYVTLDKKENARDVCKYNHSEEDDDKIYISSVEMASEEDLQLYSDMFSVHGVDFTAPGMGKKLLDIVEKEMNISQAVILPPEDSNSAIIKFPNEDLRVISAATWKCAKELNNVCLTTAPVPKSQSIYVTGGLKKEHLPILKKYFANSRRSGGGHCSVKEHNDGAMVIFKNISEQETVLRKGHHRIEGVNLILSPSVYRQSKIPGQPKKSNKGDSKKEQSKHDTEAKDDSKKQQSRHDTETEDDSKKQQSKHESKGKQSKTSSGSKEPRTIKAKVMDLTKHRDYYEWFFKEKITSDIDKKTMFLDGLNSSLYVTFQDPEDATKICGLDVKELQENNIQSVEMVSSTDDHFKNAISIHGIDFSDHKIKDKLCELLKKKSGLEVVDIVTREEPKSAIISFDTDTVKDEIYEVAWACAVEMEGAKLVTSPVPFSTMLSLTGDIANIDVKTMKRLMSSKEYGGDHVVDCRKLHDMFLVTFKNSEVCEKVNQKNEFTLQGETLKLCEYHKCLGQEAYQDFLQNLPPAMQAMLSPKERKSRINKKIAFNKFDDIGCIILKRSHFQKECGEKCPNSEININVKECYISIEVETNEDFELINQMVRRYKNDFKYSSLSEVNQNLKDYLSTSYGQEKINKSFDDEGIAACLNKLKVYYYDEALKEADSLIKKSVVAKSTKSSRPNILLLKSGKNREFVENLKQETGCCLNFEKEEHITMTGFKKDAKACQKKLEQFFSTQGIKEKKIPCTHEKIQFFDQFCASDLEKLKTQKCGAQIEILKEEIALKGPQSFIDQAEKYFEDLRISSQDKDFMYDGIEEFLQDDMGQRQMKTVGDRNRCLLYLKGQNRSQSKQDLILQSKTVGYCDVEKTKVTFSLGDFWSLSVDCIISVVSENLNMAITKKVFLNGGVDLRNDFDAKRDFTPGKIIETKGGKLPCTSVFHIVLMLDTPEDSKVSYLKTSIEQSLQAAKRKGYTKIAFPFLGCDEFNMEAFKATLCMKNTVTEFLKKNSSIKEIIFCDTKEGNITKLMDRFDNMKERENLTPTKKPDKDKAVKKFGAITVSIKEGNLLREKCDVIANSLRNDINFNNSGGVAKAIQSTCGEKIQAECHEKESELGEMGVIMTSAPNLSCSNIIHINMSKYSRKWDVGIAKMLQMAEDKSFKSLALPAFGAGSKRADYMRTKETLLKGISDFSAKKPTHLRDIRLIISSRALYKEFIDEESESAGAAHSSDSAIQLSSKSTVVVWSDKVENRQNAMKELKEYLQETSTVKHVNITSINELRGAEKSKVVTKGSMLALKVKVLDSGLEIRGFNKDGIADIVSFATNLVVAFKDKDQKELLANVSMIKKWQFNRKDKWISFEQGMNAQIEGAYKRRLKEIVLKDEKHRHYIIDFGDMKEYTSDDGSTKGKELCQVRRLDSRKEGFLPPKWDKMKPEENLKIIEVRQGSQEFQVVEKYFKDGGATNPIKKIERVQNKALYQQYMIRKKALDRQNPKDHENEKRLFHGTDATTVTLVNESGFNRSFCGKNGTVHGDGVYFAVNSSYSVNYAKADAQGNKLMYQARVLVGESTKSQAGMKTLPNKPGTNIPYDSGLGPNMYIIFHDTHVYPEYIITF